MAPMSQMPLMWVTTDQPAQATPCAHTLCGSEDGRSDLSGGCSSAGSSSADQPQPCRHNEWTRVRKMRHTKVVLRCKVCDAEWLTALNRHTKCEGFYKGLCKLGGDCPHPHIHAKESCAARWGADAPHAPERVAVEPPCLSLPLTDSALSQLLSHVEQSLKANALGF